jgi:hypothetical protein
MLGDFTAGLTTSQSVTILFSTLASIGRKKQLLALLLQVQETLGGMLSTLTLLVLIQFMLVKMKCLVIQ